MIVFAEWGRKQEGQDGGFEKNQLDQSETVSAGGFTFVCGREDRSFVGLLNRKNRGVVEGFGMDMTDMTFLAEEGLRERG